VLQLKGNLIQKIKLEGNKTYFLIIILKKGEYTV